MTSILPMLFELIFSMIDVILLNKFSNIFLQENRENFIAKAVITICTALLPFSFHFMTYFSSFTTIILFVSVIMYVNVIFEGSTIDKIGVATLYYLSLGIITLIVTSAFVFLTAINSSDLQEILFVRILVGLLIKGTYFISVEALNYFSQKYIKKLTPAYSYSKVSIFHIYIFLILLVFFNHLFTSENILDKRSISLVMFSFGFLMMLLIILIHQYYYNKAKVLEYDFYLKESDLKKKEEMRILNHSIDILSTKHDLQNHLITLSYLIENNKKESALEYINNIHAIDAFKTMVDSENIVVNALLNEKISDNPDIKFNIQMEINYFPFDDKDLTILLGNSLDNAVEAVKFLPENERIITISISENYQYGKIVISNAYTGIINTNDGNIFSKKRNNERGFGLNNIKIVVQKYNGKLETSTTNNIFRVTILLPKSQFT